MPTALYVKLKSLDPDLAEAYRRATSNDDPNFLIETSTFLKEKQTKPREVDRAGVRLIAAKLLADEKVPPKEAEAFGLILENVRFGEDAGKLMLSRMANLEEAVTRGSAKRLRGKELNLIHRALEAATGNISFQSPETGIIYSPNHYQAINRMVAKGDITVLQWEEINGPMAQYRPTGDMAYASTKDRINILTAIPDNEFFPKVVHECTHAIQDWLNVVAARKYCEADAYVAQAVVYKTMREQLQPGQTEPPSVAFDYAAPVVMARKALNMTKEWEDAYYKVVNAIEAHPVYRAEANQVYPVLEKKEPAERVLMTDLVDRIQKEKTSGTPAKAGK